MSGRRREDLLVSICFPEFLLRHDHCATLRALARRINAAYRFWEILIIVEETDSSRYEEVLGYHRNIRFLKVRKAAGIYRMRAVVAAEAIGDVIVLTSPDEASILDIPAMIARAHRDHALVIARRNRQSLLEPAIAALGRASGFRSSARDMQTMAYPRGILANLLKHPDRLLVLRFPPRDTSIPIAVQECERHCAAGRRLNTLAERLSLVQRLVVNLAPRVLSGVSVLSVALLGLSIAYAAYTVLAWLILPSVQPGWTTLSLVLSFTMGFLGLALFGLTTGMQKILDLLCPSDLDDVIGESPSVDLFRGLVRELNVEVESRTLRASNPKPKKHKEKAVPR